MMDGLYIISSLLTLCDHTDNTELQLKSNISTIILMAAITILPYLPPSLSKSSVREDSWLFKTTEVLEMKEQMKNKRESHPALW